MKPCIKLLVILLALMTPCAVLAETAAEALESARLWGNTEHAVMTVSLDIDTGRGEKSRTLEVFIEHDGDESKLFARVTVPPFLSRMKYLYLRSAGGGESRWIATSRGTRQLSNAQRTEKLFDSDFTTEDLSMLAVDEYDVSYAGTNGTDGKIVVRAEAKNGNAATRVISIDPGSRLITRVEYLNAEDGIARLYVVEETRTVDGVPTVGVCSMTDIDAGTTTMLTVDSFDPDADIPARIFSRASL